MKWNWERQDWPNFAYKINSTQNLEMEFQNRAGVLSGVYRHFSSEDAENFKNQLEAAGATVKVE